MLMLNLFSSFLRNLFGRKSLDQDLHREVNSYLDLLTEEKVRQGMPAPEARRAARIELGGVEQVKEEVRDIRMGAWFPAFGQDLRYGHRMLRKSPAFTAIAVLTISLGIGANTAIFSMVDWLLLRPLPVQNPAQLTYLAAQYKNGGYANAFSYPNFQDIREQSASVFSHVAAVRPFQMDGLSVDGQSGTFWTNYVTGDFFPMLGIRPALGRFILPSEGKVAGADPVLVLSYSFWQSRFGGATGVIGKKVTVNGQPVTIIGVTPQGFHGVLEVLDIQGYLPMGMAATNLVAKDDFLIKREEMAELILIARLKPDVSLAAAQPALDVVARRLSEQYPQVDEWKSLNVRHLGSIVSSSPVNPVPMISGFFLFLAGLVLLLACVNVANLLLVRVGVRSREMAVRAALGAGRARLLQQMLTESILLALLGCAGGILLGLGGSAALSSIKLGAAFPIVLDFNFNWHVFLFALAVALGTGIFVGLVPALRASRSNLRDVLHEGGRTSTAGRQRLRSVLVMAQVAGSLLLLIIAGLFVRSLQQVQHINLGFDLDHVLNLSMDPHEAGYNETKGIQFFSELLQRVRALPGIQSASVAATVPMGPYEYGGPLEISGYQPPTGSEKPSAGYNAVSSGYFETLQIPVLRGRGILDSDNQNSQHVAVINEAMANKFWPNQDPIGRHFSSLEDPTHPVDFQIVGVAKNSHTGDISSPIAPYFYMPFAQKYMVPATVHVRTVATPESMAHEILQAVNSIEPAMPVFDVQTMAQAIDGLNGLMLYKFGAVLAASLGILGLVLAVVGVYGVVSYAASQRTHEIGIRMALGALPAAILKMIFRQGILIIAAGLLAGILASVAIARLIGNFLVGVAPTDPLTFLVVSSLLAIVALLACYIPARRAMRVDPMVALRYE